jgi:DNA-binding XRE family transcriptional regulator
MTSQDLRDWRARLGLTQAAAAATLGITLRGYQKREMGEAPIDREAELACLYLEEHPEEMRRPLTPRAD